MIRLVDLSIRIHKSVREIQPTDWDALVGPDSPMLNHAWLDALESSGSASPANGWHPRHIALRSGKRLIGAIPVYAKTHSMGELLYDFSWASSLQSQGYPYYPKLIVANPFTPITSRKLLLHPQLSQKQRERLYPHLFDALRNEALGRQAHSVHFHFLPEDEAALLTRFGFIHHHTSQYHWLRGNAATFEDFLGGLRSKTRREIRRERKKLRELGYTVEAVEGAQITPELMDSIFAFYTATHQKFGWGAGHLTHDFFRRIRETLPQHLKLFLAYDPQHNLIAGTFNLVSGTTLYGRYWGASEEVPFLHFETCLYAMIDHALANGYDRIEPGQGGEHKLARGYEPRTMHSVHWFRDPRVHTAMEHALTMMRASHLEQMEQMRQMSHITALTGDRPSPDDD